MHQWNIYVDICNATTLMIPCSCYIWQAQKRASVTPCVVGLERVMGIEPTFKAWEALVLPLNYTRTALELTPSTEKR